MMMAAAAKNRSVFAIVVSIAVVVAVVAVGVLVYFMNRAASAPAEAPAAGVVNEETGAIVIGDEDAEQTVTEYIDFMCPICNNAHDAYGDTLSELVESGEIAYEVHPISILDNLSQGTEFSTRAAAAAYCVAEDNGDAVYPFMDLMFRNQPAEGSAGLSDDEIAGYAADAGADGAASCISEGTHKEFVSQQSDTATSDPELAGEGGRFGTPTLLVNGEKIAVTMNAEADIVANLD